MRKISQEELNEIIESHGRWLRNEEGGKSADLRGTNLCSADLRDTNLGGADLRNADLRNADLRNADLRNADLGNANLGSADLGSADLGGADLGGADLRNANLGSANLGDANLGGADLRNANLGSANLGDANLGGADLRNTRMDKRYYQVVRIGSRKDTTTYNATDDNVTCGCWNAYKGGTLAEFRERVENVYGADGEKPNERYYAEYMAAIEFFGKMRGVKND